MAEGQTEEAGVAARPADYKPRAKVLYEETAREALLDEFKYENVMQVPKVEKVVINMGIGEAVNDRKKVENAANDLALIAGQRPVITRARKSIASFKVREGMALGAKVTLRGVRMYEFLDRLTTIALGLRCELALPHESCGAHQDPKTTRSAACAPGAADTELHTSRFSCP